jgi:hypothetical protein
MPPPAPLFLSLPSPPPPLLPVHHHPKAPQALSLALPLACSSSRKPALPACPVASSRHSDYFDPRAPPPPRGDGGYGRPPNGAHEGRVFTSYSIYKGKAALSFDPRPPQFVPLDVGRGGAAVAWCLSMRGFCSSFTPVITLIGVLGVRKFVVWGVQGGQGGVRAAAVRASRGYTPV